jgi:hypothetical protein
LEPPLLLSDEPLLAAAQALAAPTLWVGVTLVLPLAVSSGEVHPNAMPVIAKQVHDRRRVGCEGAR